MGAALITGASSGRLFKSGIVASSHEVARLGYTAMMNGKAMTIPGFLNKILVQLLNTLIKFVESRRRPS